MKIMAKIAKQDIEGEHIFQLLCQKLLQEEFDEVYLQSLEKFQALYPWSEQADIFVAEFAFAMGDYAEALINAQKAFAKRKLSLAVWRLLSKIYVALGDLWQADIWDSYANNLYAVTWKMHFKDYTSLELLKLSMTQTIGNYAPFLHNYLCKHDDEVCKRSVTLAYKFIPGTENDDGSAMWVGAYTDQDMLDYKGQLLFREKDNSDFAVNCGADFVFDIIRSKQRQEWCFDCQGKKYIVPIAGTVPKQEAKIQSRQCQYTAFLDFGAFEFYRVEHPIRIVSEQPFIVGKPVLLEHSAKRKKVVLNILVDALSWHALKQRQYNDIPNMMNFFQKGVIFDQHFSVGEYTYPSLPTIETGMYPHHTQLFNENVNMPLNKEYATISEQMRKLGYYCVDIMGDGSGIYNGCMRGFDRYVINGYALRTAEGVERTIQHLEAFAECDQFIFMHIMDAHPWAASKASIPLGAQTTLPLEERLQGSEEKVTSVNLGKNPVNMAANIQGVHNVDRALKPLFDYLEKHYSDDEYLVQLYSDHGASVFDNYPRVVSQYQTNSVYMLRGADVPRGGILDEMTSSIDMYPVMGHLLGFEIPPYVDGNLPAVFGGKERNYTYSNSIFPEQPYMLAIRNQQYEFFMRSEAKVAHDGTVNLNEVSAVVWDRIHGYEQVYDDSILKFFYNLADKHTYTFNSGGRIWPEQYFAMKDK